MLLLLHLRLSQYMLEPVHEPDIRNFLFLRNSSVIVQLLSEPGLHVLVVGVGVGVG